MRPHFPRPRSRRAAFTLLELMIVVVVIMVVAALAAPAIGRAMHERRAREATLDLVRLVRNARSEAAAYGRAHLLVTNPAADGGNGTVTLYRGRNNRCNVDWGPITAATPCAGNAYCVDQLSMARYSPGDTAVRLRIANVPGAEVCYQPTGVMYWRDNPSNPFTDLNSDQLGGGVRFTLTPIADDTVTGVVRRVVLPLGGDARVVR